VRTLALDLGSRRIGVAVSDPSGILATPHIVLERAARVDLDHDAVVALVAEVGAERVVVGLPRSLDGSDGPAVRLVRAEAEKLAARLPVPLEYHDERFTTVSANRSLVAAGMKAPERRRVVDKVAAAVLLQSWLDRRPPEEAR